MKPGSETWHLALARLWRSGHLRRGAATGAASDHAVAVGWATQTVRARDVALTTAGAEAIPQLLDRVWPDWRADLAALETASLPLTIEGMARLEARRKLDALPVVNLPPRLNRRTVQARWARHSKASLDPVASAHLGSSILTTDDVVRLRPNRGLVLRRGDCVDETPGAVTGEVVVPERALLDGLAFEGAAPRFVLTVENLGAFVDLPAPPDALVVWLPGWNSPLALTLVERLPPTPLVHFGDLDPDGAAIVAHLRQRVGAPVHWFVPDFWSDYVETHALTCEHAWPPPADDWPPLVRRLAASNRWLEQEAIVPDPCFASALARLGD